MLAVMLAVTPAVLAIDPRFAKNITVYHVNEHKFGAIPVNMDTGDALGDMFFDMLEVIMYPLACPNGTHTVPPSPYYNPCLNPEAAGADLMVNKLTLEVDTRFSGYAACNVGLANNSDPFGGYCKTDTYCCDCVSGSHMHRHKVPCNATVGEENLYESFGQFLHAGCRRSILQPHPSKVDCYRGNVFGKLNATDHGTWYSSLDKARPLLAAAPSGSYESPPRSCLRQGYCDAAPSSSFALSPSPSCTWRVVRVNKIVQRACHTRVFGAEVGKAAPACFDGCGDQKDNVRRLRHKPSDCR